jgi:protocatechuate 3,4-dioxygenase beta subunit
MTNKRFFAARWALTGSVVLAAAVLALGVATAGSSTAQSARGIAEGRVTDSAGNVLKGVSVKLTYIQIKTIGKSAGFDPDQKPEMLLVKTVGVQVSDDEGKVTFANLEPRQYTAVAYTAAAGGAEVSVQVEAGKTAKFDMKLAKNR